MERQMSMMGWTGVGEWIEAWVFAIPSGRLNDAHRRHHRRTFVQNHSCAELYNSASKKMKRCREGVAVAAAGSMLQQARAQADSKGLLNTCSRFRMRAKDTIL